MMPAAVPPSTTTGPTVSTAGTTPASTSARRLGFRGLRQPVGAADHEQDRPWAGDPERRRHRGDRRPGARLDHQRPVAAREGDLGRLIVAGSVGHARHGAPQRSGISAPALPKNSCFSRGPKVRPPRMSQAALTHASGRMSQRRTPSRSSEMKSCRSPVAEREHRLAADRDRVADTLAGVHVPEDDVLVLAGRCEPVAVRADGQRVDPIGVAEQLPANVSRAIGRRWSR